MGSSNGTSLSASRIEHQPSKNLVREGVAEVEAKEAAMAKGRAEVMGAAATGVVDWEAARL